jgi:WD40 repeat protein
LPGAVARVKFSHDGTRLAVVGFGQPLQLLQTDTGQSVGEFVCPCRDMRTIVFSPDDTLLAGGGRNGRVRIWDVRAGQERTTFVAHRQRIRDLTFDATGRRLITAGEDRAVRVWEVDGWQETCVLAGVPGKVLALTALPDGRLATAGSDNVIRIWDLERRELISQLRGHQGSVAALDANERWLVSGSFDATIKIWPLVDMNRALAELQRQRSVSPSRLPADGTTRPTSVEPID